MGEINFHYIHTVLNKLSHHNKVNYIWTTKTPTNKTKTGDNLASCRIPEFMECLVPKRSTATTHPLHTSTTTCQGLMSTLVWYTPSDPTSTPSPPWVTNATPLWQWCPLKPTPSTTTKASPIPSKTPNSEANNFPFQGPTSSHHKLIDQTLCMDLLGYLALQGHKADNYQSLGRCLQLLSNAFECKKATKGRVSSSLSQMKRIRTRTMSLTQ